MVGFRGSATVPIVGLSESQADRLGVPPWVAGFASRGVIVVIPARAASYPNDGLEDLVLHELAHVLIQADVPRWFNEGVAMFAATGWSLEDQTRLAVTLISAGQMPLSRLDRLFSGDVASVSRAYSVAGAFVRFVVERHGLDSVAGILDRVRNGSNFESAFLAETGESLPAAEAEFWRERTVWSRWVPLVTSSVTLWIMVTLFALAAITARRRRNAARLKAWEKEEDFD